MLTSQKMEGQDSRLLVKEPDWPLYFQQDDHEGRDGRFHLGYNFSWTLWDANESKIFLVLHKKDTARTIYKQEFYYAKIVK